MSRPRNEKSTFHVKENKGDALHGKARVVTLYDIVAHPGNNSLPTSVRSLHSVGTTDINYCMFANFIQITSFFKIYS